MNKLIYEFASKSFSARAHEAAYGSAAYPNFQPVDLNSKFRFECKKTGNCCRDRALASNMIFGDSQIIPIRKFCETAGISVHGHKTHHPLPMLRLDGDGTRLVVRAGIDRGIAHGFAYAGDRGGTCQFLAGSLCSIHPVKPTLCRAAPIGWILENHENGGKIALAFHKHKRLTCPECMDGPERTVRDWIDGVITNDYLNDERARAGWPRIIA